MSRIPNSEQLKAIEHTGGVLLKAGAGSGKTFVLIEHIIYLTRKWIDDFKLNSSQSFDEFIRVKYSKLVMMTFTKKAAGEMSIRLYERFKSETLNSNLDSSFWFTANDALPFITVTTIDGFCKKLISLGYFPGASQNSEVIFFNQRKFQIKEIISDFFETNKNLETDENYEVILRRKENLINCFTDIFSDPGSRLHWEKFDPMSLDLKLLDSCLEESFFLNNLNDHLESVKQLKIPLLDKEKSAFERNVAIFQATSLPYVKNLNVFKMYLGIFSSFKTLQPERTQSKKDLDHEQAHIGLVALKSWLKDWQEVVENFEEFLELKILPWAKMTKTIFDFINIKLDFSSGLTFGDMEYVVYKGLIQPEVRLNVSKDFDYFIVDEFQDTSEVQFSIISNLINNDFSKLFCVGDAKQAIYGFRGGELSVFSKCSDLVPENLSLNLNYRSSEKVIEFNNSLFSKIFPLGREFQGKDKFSVKHENQLYPRVEADQFPGQIVIYKKRITCDPEEKFKPSTAIVNKIEAEIIANIIIQTKEKFPQENICILYQKLSPSVDLIKKLISLKNGFTAQFKIDPSDDPILIIFLALLKRKFDANFNTRDDFCCLVIKSVLSKLGISKDISLETLNSYDLNCNYFGASIGFRMFISTLNLSIENFDLNLKVIDDLIITFRENFEQVFLNLSQLNSEKISLEFRFGNNSDIVKIMTAHASKGLEFDSVILGGVLTNGKDQFETALIGKIPGSFNWFKNISLKESYLTPPALLEKEITKLKNFSESKRLFYVACTRAKKRLCWVDLDFDGATFSFPRNSWIEGLRKWKSIGDDFNQLAEVELDSDFQSLISANTRSENLPLYFYDQVGIYQKSGDSKFLGLVPDLSVTRLSSLLECPRKFYFENVLKLSTQNDSVFFDEFNEQTIEVLATTADRGTEIHSEIAQMIARNFIVPRKYVGKKEEENFQWIADQMSALRSDYEFRSEKALKFKFFNFMISGIPDLVLNPLDNNSKFQIWDFKTGSPNTIKLDHYWLQLKIYAYALYEMNFCKKDLDIELVISLFDIKKNLNLRVDYHSLVKDLYMVWERILRPWEIKVDHCSQCSFGDICPR